MKHYVLGRVFKKHWFWFARPCHVPDADMVNFFSYDGGEYPPFARKETLTSIVDLTPTIEGIRAKMREKFIRKQIERGERRGIVVAHNDDFEVFYPMYLRFRKGKHLARERFSTFKENGLLFLAFFGNKPLAGGVFLGDGKYMRAWVLASERLDAVSGRMRDVIGEANRMVIWEAIKYAKKEGYTHFDFGGIEPDATAPDARSLAEFKEAFGGERRPAYYYHTVYSRFLKAWIAIRGVFF